MGVEPKNILIVGEDADTRSTLMRTLQHNGFAVEGSADDRQALGRIHRGGLDLIVAVTKNGQGSGVELLDAVGRLITPVPVILVSGCGTVAAAVEAIQRGARDFLVLPVEPERLTAAARAAIAGGEAVLHGTQGPEHRLGQKSFLTHDPHLLEVLAMARQVARSTATVLIQGESGTGKELLAAYIHRHGLHPEAPYVAVNCAALPETLAESELFGHEKGAFTGALMRKIGKFELAKKGTIVLDEVGEMALPLQAKLLRVLQEREVDRIGGGMPVPVEARVVAITNRDLSTSVRDGAFREDLFFRLNVVPLVIPPLRDRPGDIQLLADHFLARFSAQVGKAVSRFSEQALQSLNQHPWKGNVRELANRIERAILLVEGDMIQPRHLGLEPAGGVQAGARPAMVFRSGITVWEMERQLIMGTLSEVDQNRTRAAELLGISIRTLRNKLREYRSNAVPPVAARSA
ncbi:MAG: sigma-54 dependent transcriptional regulator [Desulfobacterales bacterium]|nr:sigma-54 dependent transcriptional regulator [Desulfobacterales bacterium]